MTESLLKPHKIKICGVTIKEQAQQIAELGFGTLGFILYEKSPRYVDLKTAADIANSLPPFTSKVAVVVNMKISEVAQVYETRAFTKIQLHGDESPEFCAELDKLNIPWIKAFRVGEDFSESILKSYPTNLFLLDAYDKNSFGGTGKTLNWNRVKSLCRDYKIILAGGLNGENIREAWEICRPTGLDISSGVEDSPGVKSMEKIAEVLKASN